MTPVRTTVNLTPALPGATVTTRENSPFYFEQTVALWEERWVQYRICIPSSFRREQLYVSLTTHCTSLRYWRNWQDFRWASQDCHDATNLLAIGGTFTEVAGGVGDKNGMNSCRYTGGCYHISMKVDNGQLGQFLPQDSRKGRMLVDNPQASFTIKAWAVTAPITELPLECTLPLYNLNSVPVSATNAGEIKCGGPTQLFYVEPDFENFGTELVISFLDTAAPAIANEPTFTLVAPWYWRRVGANADGLFIPQGIFGTNYVATLFGRGTTGVDGALPANWNTWAPTGFQTAATVANRDCALAAAADDRNGVFVIDDPSGSIILNPCAFENGDTTSLSKIFLKAPPTTKATVAIRSPPSTTTSTFLLLALLSPMDSPPGGSPTLLPVAL
jgi:hypothetical protein